MSMDILQEKIRQKKNPTVAGLDPKLDYIPQHIKDEAFAKYGKTLKGCAEAYRLFCRGLIDGLHEVVPAVKPQSAYFEMLGWRGMKALEEVISYAKSKGLYVIADIKRGDIGTTAAAYSEAWLGATRVGIPTARCLTPTASPSMATWALTPSSPF